MSLFNKAGYIALNSSSNNSKQQVINETNENPVLDYECLHFEILNNQNWFKPNLITGAFDIINPRHKSLSFLSDGVKITHIPNLEGKAFIVEINGKQFINVTSELDSIDIFKLNSGLNSLNIKPSQMAFSNSIKVDKIMSYRELIDKDINIIKRQNPNLHIYMLSGLAATLADGVLGLRNHEKISKLREFVQNRRAKSQMYGGKDTEVEEDVKFAKLEKYSSDIGTFFLKLQDSEKIDFIKDKLESLNIIKFDNISDIPKIKQAYSSDDAINQIIAGKLNTDNHLSNFVLHVLKNNPKNDLKHESGLFLS